MRNLTFRFLITVVCICEMYVCFSDIYQEFIEFKQRFGKSYKDGSAEHDRRFRNFKNNLMMYRELNMTRRLNDTAIYGITKFSDLNPKEFKDLYLEDLISKPVQHNLRGKPTPADKIKSLKIPQKLDWRTHLNHSVVSAVKNQRKCGACWAFSTVETVESMYAISRGVSVPALSVQEVIDCAANNLGCSGGDTCLALNWMTKSNVPLVTEADYPLTDTSNSCNILLSKTAGVRVVNSTCYNLVGKEDSLLQLLNDVGPVTVSVDATTWNNYQGGIIQWHCSNYNNHAVQIVGYDLTGDVHYYIVRNSWGADFGHQGYLYIKIGENVCGIAQEVSAVHSGYGR